MNRSVPSYLERPTIPAAETDGLLKLSDLNQDVLVECPIWWETRPGDAYQLLLNRLPAGLGIEMPSPVPEGPLSLQLPLETLQAQGTHTVGYRITTFPGETFIDSQTVTVRIDRTAAGATLLAPMIFSQVNFGEVLTGLIPGYAHMAVGDTLQTLCNGETGPTYQISNADMTERCVRIDFSKSFLEGLGNPSITMTYQVTDRAGNQSILAIPVSLSLSG